MLVVHHFKDYLLNCIATSSSSHFHLTSVLCCVRARLRKDLRQDGIRGDPPDPQSSFRVEGPLIGEILSVWEFVMVCVAQW